MLLCLLIYFLQIHLAGVFPSDYSRVEVHSMSDFRGEKRQYSLLVRRSSYPLVEMGNRKTHHQHKWVLDHLYFVGIRGLMCFGIFDRVQDY